MNFSESLAYFTGGTTKVGEGNEVLQGCENDFFLLLSSSFGGGALEVDGKPFTPPPSPRFPAKLCAKTACKHGGKKRGGEVVKRNHSKMEAPFPFDVAP